MALFQAELPTELINDIQKLHDNSEKMFGEMTRAGAEVVKNNMLNNAPSILTPYIKLSKTYKTPSDNGINTKAYISGYIPFSDPNRKYFTRNGHSTSEGVPASFLANLYEHGRSTAPFPKHPFMRRSMNAGQIDEAMRKAQMSASGGLINE